MKPLYDCRDAFAQAVLELAEADDRIVMLSNDSVGSSKLGAFQQRFPDRLVNVGIAEQDLVGISAGLSFAGKIPFACSAACFLTARALEQIKVDVAYSDANVKLVGMSSGLAYGSLGGTHHSIEDVAWLRAVANMTVVVPADPIETAQAVRFAAQTVGPIYLRVSRMKVPIVHDSTHRFAIGRATILRPGSDVTLIANGIMVARALEAAERLAGAGIEARVINMATVKPIDEAAIVAAARDTGGIVTVEEHTVYGGLGSAVAEVVAQRAPCPLRILGVPGIFAPTGEAPWLLEHFGLTPRGIEEATRHLLRARRL